MSIQRNKGSANDSTTRLQRIYVSRPHAGQMEMHGVGSTRAESDFTRPVPALDNQFPAQHTRSCTPRTRVHTTPTKVLYQAHVSDLHHASINHVRHMPPCRPARAAAHAHHHRRAACSRSTPRRTCAPASSSHGAERPAAAPQARSVVERGEERNRALDPVRRKGLDIPRECARARLLGGKLYHEHKVCRVAGGRKGASSRERLVHRA